MADPKKTPLTPEQLAKLEAYRAQQAASGEPVNFGGPTTFPKAFQTIVDVLSDKEVQDEIYRNYLEEVKNIKDPALRAKAAGADKTRVLKNLMQLQKQNYAIANNKTDLSDTEDIWDRTSVTDKSGKKWGKNEKYKTTMSHLGFKPEEILGSDEDIIIAQAAYNSTLKAAGPNSKIKNKFGMLDPLTGKKDETYDSTGKLSPPDSWYGNTTAGQLLKYKGDNVVETPPIAEEEKKTPGPIETKVDHLNVPQAPAGSPWWLQDIIKTAHAAGDLWRTKKYMPWQATADIERPRVSFFDPTRELAANAEQVNIGAQNLAQFTGPQAFNSRFSQMQGRGLAGAADTISRVHNQNVDISNRQSAMNADYANRANEQRAHQATSLWDKYQAVNQNFDYAKSHARNALVNQYTNAITNKAYTHNLNQMYPQYAINPMSGGEFYFRNPRDFNPDKSQAKTAAQIYEDLLGTHPTWRSTPEGNKMAYEEAKRQAGIKPTANDAYTEYQEAMKYAPRYPGSET
jgi:hypothetical protein